MQQSVVRDTTKFFFNAVGNLDLYRCFSHDWLLHDVIAIGHLINQLINHLPTVTTLTTAGAATSTDLPDQK